MLQYREKENDVDEHQRRYDSEYRKEYRWLFQGEYRKQEDSGDEDEAGADDFYGQITQSIFEAARRCEERRLV